MIPGMMKSQPHGEGGASSKGEQVNPTANQSITDYLSKVYVSSRAVAWILHPNTKATPADIITGSTLGYYARLCQRPEGIPAEPEQNGAQLST